MACRADKPDCIKALLLAGADVNKEAGTGDINYSEPGYVGNFLLDNPNTLYHEDMKNGGTPLHWAKSRQGMEGLLEANCNINALNFQKKTALHVMVERERWVGLGGGVVELNRVFVQAGLRRDPFESAGER